MEKEYAIKSFICILIIFITLCFMPWKIDIEPKEYTAKELNHEIDTLYEIQKEIAEIELKHQQKLLENLESVYLKLKYECNIPDEYNEAKKDVDDLKEKIRYNIWFSRDDTRIVFEDKSFEKRVYVTLKPARIITLLMLLYFGYKIYAINKKAKEE